MPKREAEPAPWSHDLDQSHAAPRTRHRGYGGRKISTAQPKLPLYCRAPPTEAVPSLAKPLSSRLNTPLPTHAPVRICTTDREGFKINQRFRPCLQDCPLHLPETNCMDRRDGSGRGPSQKQGKCENTWRSSSRRNPFVHVVSAIHPACRHAARCVPKLRLLFLAASASAMASPAAMAKSSATAGGCPPGRCTL